MLNQIKEMLQKAQAGNEVETLMLDTELSPEEATQVTGGKSWGGYVPQSFGEALEFAYWGYFL